MLGILTPESRLLFRIEHVANVPWMLRHGLHAADGQMQDPEFEPIGNPDLIGRRTGFAVPLPPGGVLASYVPFYFTPRSPMLMNIQTGHNGIRRRDAEEIVVLVSACRHMADSGVTMLFTDRHAVMAAALWTADADVQAGRLDWAALQQHDFAREDRYPDKKDRYQAEALAHRHVPVGALRGIGCASERVCLKVEAMVQAAQATLKVVTRPNWYFG